MSTTTQVHSVDPRSVKVTIKKFEVDSPRPWAVAEIKFKADGYRNTVSLFFNGNDLDEVIAQFIEALENVTVESE